jgi:hypothetical protein
VKSWNLVEAALIVAEAWLMGTTKPRNKGSDAARTETPSVIDSQDDAPNQTGIAGSHDQKVVRRQSEISRKTRQDRENSALSLVLQEHSDINMDGHSDETILTPARRDSGDN